MKKILSLALAAAMMVSAIPAAYAAENEADYTAGTQIILNGSATEQYTVTVPAKMQPGDVGIVKAEGTWAADKYLQVTAPTSVTLTYGAQTMDVAVQTSREVGGVTCTDGLKLIGNSVDSISATTEITVAEASRLFGTWEGVLVYDVQLIEKGDINRDGIIDMTDLSLLRDLVSGNPTEEELLYSDIHTNGKLNALDVSIFRQVLAQNGFDIFAE